MTYARIYITFSIFNIFNVTMNNIVSSEGSAKTAMSALLVCSIKCYIRSNFYLYI
ncbi:MAG: hypothetical protein ACLRHW_07885 [Coprobacillus cateniformis]